MKQDAVSREEISALGTNPKGLLVAYGQDKTSGTGRSTQRGLDRNSCRRWDTNQAKAWERMLKVRVFYNSVYTVEYLAHLLK